MKTIIKLILFTSLFSAIGCSSTVYENDITAEGIPYNLPKSVIEVSLGFESDGNGGHQLQLSAEAKSVPDKDSFFVLSPAAEDWLVSIDHNITIENGLLKSIDIEDTGELGSVIEGATDTLINLGKTAAIAQSAPQDPFLTYQGTPTQEEIKAILLLLANNKATFTFSPEEDKEESGYVVPGTGGLLKLMIDYEKQDKDLGNWEPTSKGNKDPLNSKKTKYCNKDDISVVNSGKINQGRKQVTLNGVVLDKTNCNPVAGLYTRTLADFELEMELYIDLDRLYQKRKHSYEVRSAKLEQDFDDLSQIEESLNDKMDLVCKKEPYYQNKIYENDKIIKKLSELSLLSEGNMSHEAINSRVDLLNKQSEAYQPYLNKCLEVKLEVNDAKYKKKKSEFVKESNESIIQEHFNEDRKSKSLFKLAQVERSLLIANKDAIEIPLERANLGQTVYSMKFDQGFLTSFEHSKPSEGKVLVESLVSSTEALYDGVEAIIQLPAKALGFQLEEEKAAQALKSEKLLNKQYDLDARKQIFLRQADLGKIKENPSQYFGDIRELPPILPPAAPQDANTDEPVTDEPEGEDSGDDSGEDSGSSETPEG